jgi:hypothetical protein
MTDAELNTLRQRIHDGPVAELIAVYDAARALLAKGDMTDYRAKMHALLDAVEKVRP